MKRYRSKTPKVPQQLAISVEYMNRVEDVTAFVLDYCTRNHIPLEEKMHPRINEPYWYLIFKSNWQLDCFVRIGNRHYPYFEFL